MFIVMIFVFIAILFVSGTDYEDVKTSWIKRIEAYLHITNACIYH